MISTHRKAVIIGGLAAILVPSAALFAQSGDILKSAQLNNSTNSGLSGALGGTLGGTNNLIPGQAPSTTNINNVAGLLGYCIENNYLSGKGAASVEDSLKDKISGASPSSNSAYTDGRKGVLHGNDGNPVTLGGSGLKSAATKQICDTVLSTAKSMM